MSIDVVFLSTLETICSILMDNHSVFKIGSAHAVLDFFRYAGLGAYITFYYSAFQALYHVYSH